MLNILTWQDYFELLEWLLNPKTCASYEISRVRLKNHRL